MNQEFVLSKPTKINSLPFLERDFFRQEDRLARWGTIGIFICGIALFLALFVILLAIPAYLTCKSMALT